MTCNGGKGPKKRGAVTPPGGQRAPSHAHVVEELLFLGGVNRSLLSGLGEQNGIRVGDGGAFLQISGIRALEAAVEKVHSPGTSWCVLGTYVEARSRSEGAPTHAPLKGRAPPPPSYPSPQLPIPPSLALREPPEQPGGVACRRPAPLMFSGTTVIGQPLVTCGDCGGPGCCGSRSANRGSGSGSGSRVFKGDAAAARRGDGGQVERAAQMHIIHGPSGVEGLVRARTQNSGGG